MATKLLDGAGWKARGDRQPPSPARRFFPRIKHAFKLIPVVLRLCIYTLRQWWRGRRPFIDIFNVMRYNKYAGVPMGGIGCGSIGTDFRGGFDKFCLLPGQKEQSTTAIKADNFIISVHSEQGELIYQSLLSCVKYRERVLSTWKTMKPDNIRYRGLYPRAWREYKLDDTGIVVVCEQLSPVIPHNYDDTSMPITNFEFHVVNTADKRFNVSITFTFRNGTGNKRWEMEGTCGSEELSRDGTRGLSLSHSIGQFPLTYGIMTNEDDDHNVSITNFDPTGDGRDIYNDLKAYNKIGYTEMPFTPNAKQLGIAVCSQFFVDSNTTGKALFSLTWHMPIVSFGSGGRAYKKRYTRFFDSGSETSVSATMATYGLRSHEVWQKCIEEWQRPVLEDQTLPDWYKSALFNELYYITDGGSFWFEFDDSWMDDENLMSRATQEYMKDFGRFGYLESWEYLMVNTYDVHFYACWAFLENWPAIELSLQLDFTDQVCRVDGGRMESMCEGQAMWVKNYARVPHDMGHPYDDPWLHTNAYLLHDTADWRDLNLKYVIGCWRDWKLVASSTPDAELCLRAFYERSKLIVQAALSDWDNDNDGVIENSGIADQTYDVWKMTGTSAYCGSLWLATLMCFIQMAKTLEIESEVEHYTQVLRRAAISFNDKLWNGRFFSFDENDSNKDVVMADQLAGLWALAMMDEELPIEVEKVKIALKTIYDLNVVAFQNGELGAVNGMLDKDGGKVDSSCIQSEEVWSGSVYALSSFMMQMGLFEEGFKTSQGLHNSLWNRFPLQFQTPEAITASGMYRAIGYMRPLSIWAIHRSLRKTNYSSSN